MTRFQNDMSCWMFNFIHSLTVTVTVTEALYCAPTGRPRAHHRVSPYPGARKHSQTEMFSDHDEMSPSIAAVSATSADCSMFHPVPLTLNCEYRMPFAVLFVYCEL